MINRTRKAFIAVAFVVALGTAAFVPGAAQAQKQSGSPAKPSKRAQPLTARKHYSCPMHPEVKTAKRGRCPKCGMYLQLTLNAPAPSVAESGGGTPAPAPPADKMVLPDLELLDQDGRKVNFYSDLVQGRVVVINFIFTTCTTICPPLGATFARVQKDLGERAGRDVHFISISVDPTTDTPERLKAWGAKFRAGPAWTFVTGQRPNVYKVLQALGAATASPQDHSPTILIGNDLLGQWVRTYGLARPSQIVQVIDDAIAGRLGATREAVKQ